MKKSRKLFAILWVLVALAIVLVAVIAMQPADFRVTRSAAMTAPVAAVFAQVNDLRNWDAWSPWAKLDPAAKQTFDGPASGTGASFAWSGNHEVGEGRMTITESRSNELVRFRLDFVKPFASTCDTEFTFKPEGTQTVVAWTMTGKNNFLAKAIGLFMDCEKMVGDQFERGLAQMKSVVEGAAQTGGVAARP